MTKILALAGSNRIESVNNRLLQIACEQASAAGAEVTHIQLRDYELPLFDQDLESREGQPENAARLKTMFGQHSGLLVACPEYNGSITPLLKNTIDWLSRKVGDEAPLAAFAGKTACLLSASPGALGGIRGLRHVREILTGIQVLVTPQQFALPNAFSAFDDHGGLQENEQSQRLQRCVEAFVDTMQRMAGD